MKKYKIVLLPKAQISLTEITDYLCRKASDKVAKKVKKEILSTIRKLEYLPASHAKVLELTDTSISYCRYTNTKPSST